MTNENILKKTDVLFSEIENSDLELDIKIALLKVISHKALAGVNYLGKEGLTV
jgi:hypothetical protein